MCCYYLTACQTLRCHHPSRRPFSCHPQRSRAACRCRSIACHRRRVWPAPSLLFIVTPFLPILSLFLPDIGRPHPGACVIATLKCRSGPYRKYRASCRLCRPAGRRPGRRLSRASEAANRNTLRIVMGLKVSYIEIPVERCCDGFDSAVVRFQLPPSSLHIVLHMSPLTCGNIPVDDYTRATGGSANTGDPRCCQRIMNIDCG